MKHVKSFNEEFNLLKGKYKKELTKKQTSNYISLEHIIDNKDKIVLELKMEDLQNLNLDILTDSKIDSIIDDYLAEFEFQDIKPRVYKALQYDFSNSSVSNLHNTMSFKGYAHPDLILDNDFLIKYDISIISESEFIDISEHDRDDVIEIQSNEYSISEYAKSVTKLANIDENINKKIKSNNLIHEFTSKWSPEINSIPSITYSITFKANNKILKEKYLKFIDKVKPEFYWRP